MTDFTLQTLGVASSGSQSTVNAVRRR